VVKETGTCPSMASHYSFYTTPPIKTVNNEGTCNAGLVRTYLITVRDRARVTNAYCGVSCACFRYFLVLVSNYNPAARRAVPSGIYGKQTALPTRTGACPASQVLTVKDLTQSDTLVNCNCLVCTLYRRIHVVKKSQAYCSNAVYYDVDLPNL
jgi:hypothetical protein